MKLVDMNWYLWEAICMEINMMQSYGLATTGMVVEMNAISAGVRECGRFTDGHRRRAIVLQDEINQDDLRKAYKLRNEDYERLGA